MKKYTLEEFKESYKYIEWDAYDSEGAYKVVKIGFDKYDMHSALEYHCVKDNCNCTGSWITGNEDQVIEWVKRD